MFDNVSDCVKMKIHSILYCTQAQNQMSFIFDNQAYINKLYYFLSQVRHPPTEGNGEV
jgi:hypothetical protein